MGEDLYVAKGIVGTHKGTFHVAIHVSCRMCIIGRVAVKTNDV